MAWLNYSDDEVAKFHVEFLQIANQCLRAKGIEGSYSWEHHLTTSGSTIVPDFVLVENATQRWCAVVEIKRTKSSVYSTRNQIQAKGYADENRLLYRQSWPLYFILTNLESTILFAQNGSNAPRYCRIKDMTYNSGTFIGTDPKIHKAAFQDHLESIVNCCLKNRNPIFEAYWPEITKGLKEKSSELKFNVSLTYQRGHVNEDVSEYFADHRSNLESVQLLMRCLLTEYLQGILRKFKHPNVNKLSARTGSTDAFVNSMRILQTIDFDGIFETGVSDAYDVACKIKEVKASLENYIGELISKNVQKNAEIRGDSHEFPDLLVEEFFPQEVQEKKGKAQTDPELAYLLASVAIHLSPNPRKVFDPCCGDGSLLSGAYDALREIGHTHTEIVKILRGVEIDPIASKIAALRLALKEPVLISNAAQGITYCQDMFTAKKQFDANIILMNPPFKRYEAQDDSPIPVSIKDHYSKRISVDFGKVEANVGQANLFCYYVEYAVKACVDGTVLAIILDNKWYHNKHAAPLRSLLLQTCEILALLEYPHDAYFKTFSIATSLVFLKKGKPRAQHEVVFARTNNAYRSEFMSIARVISDKTVQPPSSWTLRRVLQSNLNDDGWKQFFAIKLFNEYRSEDWPNLDDLFQHSRRGSLAKEGGGIAVFEFPFTKSNYGPTRRKKAGAKAKFKTEKGKPLKKEENKILTSAANAITKDFRGYALQNADQLDGYKVSIEAAQIDECTETPKMRAKPLQRKYFGSNRIKWDALLDDVVNELKNNAHTKNYIKLISKIVGLDDSILPIDELWNVLREPVAGELIIPRKLRVGHRVHINEFAYSPSGRQLRLSSNFFSYSNCVAIDDKGGLDRKKAVELISAFLLSSFGQLQFEIESFNREGARSIEQHQLTKIKLFDPRWIIQENREEIIRTFHTLPYPVRTDLRASMQPELLALDKLFAREICKKLPGMNEDQLLDEVHQLLFEWIEMRKP